jgi:hypothetical protein
VDFLGMMLQRNGQIPNATILHQMVHSTRNKVSNKKRTISQSSTSESECKSDGKQ